jgi:phage nucleotide-binding protein
MTLTEEEKTELGITKPTSIEHLNVLIYGSYGTGKTFLLGTAQDHPDTGPLLLFDVEGGTTTLRKRPDIDIVQIRNMREVVAWHKRLYEENEKLGYKSCAIDSLSELAKLDMLEIMKVAPAVGRGAQDPDVPSPREWGIAGEHVRRIVRAYRDLPMNVFFTALLDERQDPTTNFVTYHPMFAGKPRMEVPGFIDIVGYYRAEENDGRIERVLQFQKTRKVNAKDRTDALGTQLVNPTIPEMWKIIKGA